MKVGVPQFFSWPERVPLEQVYARALQRIEVMTAAATTPWLAEHHFTTYSVCPSVHLMALEAAHRTTNLRIGTACRSPRCTTPCASPKRSRRRRSPAVASTGVRRGFEPEFAPSACRSTRPRCARGRRGRAGGVDERAADVPRQVLDFDDVEVLPAAPAAVPPDMGGGDITRRHRLGGVDGAPDPDGPARAVRRDRRQVRPLSARCRPTASPHPRTRRWPGSSPSPPPTRSRADRPQRCGVDERAAPWPGQQRGTTPTARSPLIEGYVRDASSGTPVVRRAGPTGRGKMAVPDDRPAVARVVRALHRGGAASSVSRAVMLFWPADRHAAGPVLHGLQHPEHGEWVSSISSTRIWWRHPSSIRPRTARPPRPPSP